MSRLGAVLGLLLTAMAGQSGATVIELDCRLSDRSNAYFQPQRIALRLDTDSKRAEVRDDLTAKISAKPVKGKIETFNDLRLSVTWSLRDLPRDPKLSYHNYSANVLRQRLTVRVGGEGTLVGQAPGATATAQREYRAQLRCDVLN